MLNDVTAVGNRMQGLANKVRQLDSIPLNLRTDQTNNQIENLRKNMVQIESIQGDINQAVARMDVTAANVGYQRLNNIIDSTERNIRDNLYAQEQFNQSVKNRGNAASGLEARLKGIAMSAAAAFSVHKIIALSDSVTQTVARLNLMTDGLQSTEELNQKIFASAQRARAPYMDTA